MGWGKSREIAHDSPQRCHLCVWRATAPDGSPEAGSPSAKLAPRPDPGNTRRAGLSGRDGVREEGGKGAAAAAAHTGSALSTARTEGGSAGEAVPARTPHPRGSQPRV